MGCNCVRGVPQYILSTINSIVLVIYYLIKNVSFNHVSSCTSYQKTLGLHGPWILADSYITGFVKKKIMKIRYCHKSHNNLVLTSQVKEGLLQFYSFTFFLKFIFDLKHKTFQAFNIMMMHISPILCPIFLKIIFC